MTVQPFSYAELNEAWTTLAKTPEEPALSVCDLASGTVGEKRPVAFNEVLGSDVLLRGVSSADASAGGSSPGTDYGVSVNKQVIVEGFAPSRQDVMNVLLYALSGLLLIFVMDQFTRLGLQLRRRA